MTAVDDTKRSTKAFRDAEIANLRRWAGLSGGQKIDFFEEMIELAYHSGALRADRLALRDSPPNTKKRESR